MTSNCNTIVRRDVTLGDLVPGVTIYHKESGHRKVVWRVSKDYVYYTTCGYDYIHHPKHGVLVNYEIEDNTMPAPESDEVDQLIKSRSNGTYAQISNDASKIIDTLGTGDNFAYFYSQIANKLARIKHGYSVEDSLLDIAGYAKLELEKLRGCE